jgi:hypothetical protein
LRIAIDSLLSSRLSWLSAKGAAFAVALPAADRLVALINPRIVRGLCGYCTALTRITNRFRNR